MLEHKPELRSAHLFTLTLELGPIHNIGMTPNGHRRIVEVKSGRFEGEEFSGIVLPGGGDWITMRPDEVVQLDVRLTLKTNDGELVYMTYRGMRHGPPWVMEKVNKGELKPDQLGVKVGDTSEVTICRSTGCWAWSSSRLTAGPSTSWAAGSASCRVAWPRAAC